MGLCVAPQSTHLGCLPYGINYVSNRGQISTVRSGKWRITGVTSKQRAPNGCDQQSTDGQLTGGAIGTCVPALRIPQAGSARTRGCIDLRW